MKTFLFYNQMEQENGDALGTPGQKITLTLPDGYDLSRIDPDNDEDYIYTLTEYRQTLFQFTILPPVQVPGMKIPAAVILREQADNTEGTLES